MTSIISYGQSKSPLTYDEGVEINGVKWATRNVDAVGTFALTPESMGCIYQWDRKKAWNTTDKEVVGWDNTTSKGAEWEKINDPSPAGWRVPTLDDFKSLLDSTNVASKWIVQNGVRGFQFVDKNNNNTIFFPCVVWRYRFNGLLYGVGTDPNNSGGCYWTSTKFESDGGAYSFECGISDGNTYVYCSSIYSDHGHAIRSVAE